MSTSRNPDLSGPSKKISSWVRPGVWEVRASALRPVSALIRLDFPTLERPANAISASVMAGRGAKDGAAAANCQSAANSLRPASISSSVNSGAAITAAGNARPSLLALARLLVHVLARLVVHDRVLRFLLEERVSEVVEQLDLGAVLVHDDRLLDDRQE